jgi:hypothetical protein
MILAENMEFDAENNAFGGGVFFQGAGEWVVDTRNILLPPTANNYLRFNNENGVYNIISSLNSDMTMKLDAGHLITNGNDINVASFELGNAGNRIFDIRNSQFNINFRLPGNTNVIWQFSNFTNTTNGTMEFLTEGSTINWKSGNKRMILGDGAEYNIIETDPSVPLSQPFTLEGNGIVNNFIGHGPVTFNGNHTFGYLDLITDQNHVFTAGMTTTFLPDGNIKKNGDLAKFLNLNSNSASDFHDFYKPSGSNVFVCNINVVRIKATGDNGIVFKTNAPVGAGVSTYAGVHTAAAANAAALVDNANNSWDFTAVPGMAEFEFTEPEVHYNVGDLVEIPWMIDQNDTGPFMIETLTPQGDIIIQGERSRV